MRNSKVKNILTKEMLYYEYNELRSCQKIANKFKISVDSVYKYMKLYKISYIPHYLGMYTCNENFFKKDTEEAFYWAGFIAADGSLQKRKYSKILKIALAIKDIEHIEKFKNIIQSTHIIKKYNTFAEIQITNNSIFDDLLKFNIIPNKTKTYMMPDWLINHSLINHFMRGYFDGDGCISHCGLNKNRVIKQLSWSILGTENFINQYKQILSKNCDIAIAKTIKYKNIHKIQYSGNNVVKNIYNFLYKNAKTYLDRKLYKFI